jgi:hypothetical protein
MVLVDGRFRAEVRIGVGRAVMLAVHSWRMSTSVMERVLAVISLPSLSQISLACS